MTETRHMPPKDRQIHETCTSSDLPGADIEHLYADTLNELHEQQTGTPISSDPATARIQREQAIARQKRAARGS